ncbi:MAG: LysE family translocator [Burkholderiales bacterium]|nr:MAG: LysE family translocator [Burkholderiales bacterium]
MALQTWLAFVAASTILLLIPGPTILLVVSYALGQGRRVALPMAIGVGLGDLTAMGASMLGLGALLATSATAYTALRWTGAAYLVVLGVRLWRAGGAFAVRPTRGRAQPIRMLGHAWLTTALNPKSITFFVAFLPQFIDPGRPYGAQMAIFLATFVALALANAFAYALAASSAGAAVRDPRLVRALHRSGGALLIGAGLFALLARSQPR